MAGLAVKARSIVINGRFLRDTNSAVNAVALNLTKALITSADENGWKVQLAVPKPLENPAMQLSRSVIAIGQSTGAVWDQVYMPKLREVGLPVGLFNSVPLRDSGYVTMLHDAHVFRTPQSYGFPARKWRQLTSQQAGANGNRILTVSEHSKQALLALGIGHADTIGVVPNGPSAVVSTKPDTAVLKRLELATGAPFCLGFSSLLPHKNVAFLIDVFRDQRLGDIPLVLVGSATSKDFERAGVTVPSNVIFAGRCPDTELAALYQAAQTVLIPSLEEGFGLPALEAMYFRKHPIVSPYGALPEVVGQAGYVVHDMRPSDWAQTIAKICTGHVTARECPRQQASRFTWDAAAQRVWEHLEDWGF